MYYQYLYIWLSREGDRSLIHCRYDRVAHLNNNFNVREMRMEIIIGLCVLLMIYMMYSLITSSGHVSHTEKNEKDDKTKRLTTAHKQITLPQMSSQPMRDLKWTLGDNIVWIDTNRQSVVMFRPSGMVLMHKYRYAADDLAYVIRV